MITSLINLFFPEVCAGCDGFLLGGENVICTACRHALPMTNHYATPDNEAHEKFYGKLPVEFAAALCYFHKKGLVQEIIHKLKYKSQESIGTAMGHWFAEYLKTVTVFEEIDAIIPVPLHKRRLRERGYNQVTAFGKALSESLAIPFDENVLVRNVYSKSQTRKNRAGRSSNSQSVFDIKTGAQAPKHFLLIDDVLTTGATLEACGRALLQIENAKLSIVCIAMTK
jgi:ComF family protein